MRAHLCGCVLGCAEDGGPLPCGAPAPQLAVGRLQLAEVVEMLADIAGERARAERGAAHPHPRAAEAGARLVAALAAAALGNAQRAQQELRAAEAALLAAQTEQQEQQPDGDAGATTLDGARLLLRRIDAHLDGARQVDGLVA